MTSGLGNYRFGQTVDRKPGTLLMFHGKNAMVRFHPDRVYSMLADPFRKAQIAPGDRFTMVVTRQGQRILEVRIEPIVEARPPRTRQMTPPVYQKVGRKLVTRRK